MDPTLRTQLENLHTQLGRASSVDPEARNLLIALLGDITRLLENSTSAPQGRDEEAALPDRLESVAVHFETEHPSLSAAIRGVIDALARAGV